MQSLSDDDRRAVMAAGEACAFRAGDVFFDIGDIVDRIHFMVSGAVSATMPMRDGSAVEILLIGREGAIGLPSALGPVAAFARVRAETDGASIVVPSLRFARLAQERGGLREAVSTNGASVMHAIAQTAACNAVHKLEPRLAKCLLQFHDRVRAEELPLTQDHMSRMLGVSRTTLNAVAQSLQKKGVVRYSRGRVVILDRRQLEGLCCECYEPVGPFREG